MTTVKTPGTGSGFVAVFGGNRGRPLDSNSTPADWSTATTRARGLVAWANSAGMITTNPDFWDPLLRKAIEMGLSIEFLAFTPRDSASIDYADRELPVLASLHDGNTQTIVGAVELTGSRAALLRYDQPVPRRVRPSRE